MRKNILTLSVIISGFVFLLASCGGTLGNPKEKVPVEAGAYAISFSGSHAQGKIEHMSAGGEHPLLTGKTITVEAWVKMDQPLAEIAPVFTRGESRGGNARGIALWVDVNGYVNFQVEDGAAASKEIVRSFTQINDGNWHHLAGVLVGGLHTHPVTDADNDDVQFDPDDMGGTCSNGDQSSTHIDLYIDGVYEDCDDAFFPDLENCLDADTGETIPCTNFIGRDLASVIDSSLSLFRGVIDEVRIWAETRSQAQIDFWKDTEIRGEEEWSKADPNNTIAGYWRFNEGTGDEAMDASGYGNTGIKQRCTDINGDGNAQCDALDGSEETGPWLDGWVPGYQFPY